MAVGEHLVAARRRFDRMNIVQRFTNREPKGTPSFRFAWPERLAVIFALLFALEVARLIHNDSVSPSSVSNRSFALPALGLAVVISGYGAWRFRSLPVSARVFGGLAASFLLYLLIGYALIV